MKNYTKIIVLIVFFIILISNQLFPDILYKISGKTVYNGTGIKDIGIECSGVNHRSYNKIKTNQNGDFYVYVQNGKYCLNISKDKGKGYVSSELAKFITVDRKNVTNVIFFLEKECKISGTVKFEDNTPIKDASIQVVNKRSFSMADSDSYGNYIVHGLRASDNTIVKAIIPGVELKIIENLVLSEGSVLKNINFVIPKNLSVSGKVIDKDSQEIIKDPLLIITDGKNRIPVGIKENGEFYIYNLEKKQYVIIIDHPDYGINTKSINFKGETKNIKIEIEKESE